MKTASPPILLKNGTVIDPVYATCCRKDIYICNGLIAERPASFPEGLEVLDCSGLYITPGLVDLHVHLREPGGEEAETVKSGAQAAARGGFTTIVSMPNTTPAIDSPELVRFLADPASCEAACRIIPSACITRGRLGRETALLAALVQAGAGAFTDDGATVQSDEVMREGMRIAASLGKPVMDHAQDREIEKQGGVMHEGDVSRRLGLPGIPTHAETRIIARDIRLAEETGCRLHIQHVTSAEGADLIRQARKRGLPVTGEATPHHLALCDEDIDPADADYKMNPPLRSATDREALRQAVADGTLSVLATDHAPHPAAAKARGFLHAPFGILGLETAVGVTHKILVEPGILDLAAWIKAWTCEPLNVLGLTQPPLEPGTPAHMAVLDLATPWTVDPAAFASLSVNTPFKGKTLHARCIATLLDGQFTWRRAGP